MLTGGPNPSYNVSRSIQQRYSYLVSHASHNYQHTDNGLMIAKKEIIINNETIWKRKRQRNYPSWYHMYWKVNVNTREFKRRSTYRHTMQASRTLALELQFAFRIRTWWDFLNSPSECVSSNVLRTFTQNNQVLLHCYTVLMKLCPWGRYRQLNSVLYPNNYHILKSSKIVFNRLVLK